MLCSCSRHDACHASLETDQLSTCSKTPILSPSLTLGRPPSCLWESGFFLIFCLLGPPSSLSLVVDGQRWVVSILEFYTGFPDGIAGCCCGLPLLFSFSLSCYLSLDVWGWFRFTDGVILVGLFPVSCPTNSVVSFFMMVAPISCHPQAGGSGSPSVSSSSSQCFCSAVSRKSSGW